MFCTVYDQLLLHRGEWILIYTVLCYFQGNEYGTPSETVAVSARYMSSAWSTDGCRKTIRYSDVGDYVDAGGSNYNLRTDNCLHAASRMMNLN